MKPSRLAWIRSRIELRECPIVKGQLAELCDEVERLQEQGPSGEWLEGLRRRAEESMPDGD